MLTYDLEARGRLSKYEYLYRCIREDVRTGVLAAGEKLPSKRAFAQHLSVSVSTVEQAYDLLVSEGYVRARPGSGFYVCPHRDEGTYRSARAEAASEDVQRNSEAVPPKEGQGAEGHIDFKANRCGLNLFPVDTWSRLMRRTLSERAPELFHTVPYNGLLALRQAIATYLFEFKGISTTPDRIIVGAGTEYLYNRLLQLLGPTGTIAIGDTSMSKLVDLSRGMGTSWCFVPVDEEGLCVDRLFDLKVDAVHVSPANHFPTGVVLSPERRERLLEWVHGSDRRYIIEDDYDSELRYAGRALPPLFTQDTQDRVVYLNTFSKILVPSIRISYMVLPLALTELYRARLSFYSCTVSSFEQYTLAQFINDGYLERHINRLRRYYDRQRKLVVSALESSPLMAIASIRPVNVGTHLLMHVRTRMGDADVREAAARRGMDLSMLSDYCVAPNVLNAHEVVVNFASIDPGQIGHVVDLLVDVFREDIEAAER